MADEELVINNQEPNARNFGSIKVGKGEIVDMDIEGVSGNAKATKNGKGFDVVFDIPTAPKNPNVKVTTTRNGGSTKPNEQSKEELTQEENDTIAEIETDPELSTPDVSDLRDQRDFNRELADQAPQKINPQDQQAIADDLQSNKQKKELPEDPNNLAAKPKPNEDPALLDTSEYGDLGKGDIANVPQDTAASSTPPKLDSPDQQQEAAADTSAASQAEQQAMTSAFVDDDEGAGQDMGNFKTQLLSGKFASIAKKIPFLNKYLKGLDGKGKKTLKDLKNTISLLQKLKLAIQMVKTSVAIAESIGHFAKLLTGLCETVVGIILAIIIAIPGLLVAILLGVIAPNYVSKGARGFDEIIKQINAILKKLKKAYTMMQKRQMEAQRAKQLNVMTRQRQPQAPPRPS